MEPGAAARSPSRPGIRTRARCSPSSPPTACCATATTSFASTTRSRAGKRRCSRSARSTSSGGGTSTCPNTRRCNFTGWTCAGGGSLGGGRLLAATTVGADWSRSTLFDRPIRARGLSVAPRLLYDRPLGVVDVLVGADAIAQDFDAAVPDFGRRPSDLGAIAPGVDGGRARDADAPRRPAPEHLARDSRRLLRRAGRAAIHRAAAAGRRVSGDRPADAAGERRALRADAQPARQRRRLRGVRSRRSRTADLARRIAGLRGPPAAQPDRDPHRLRGPAATDRRARHRPDVDRSRRRRLSGVAPRPRLRRRAAGASRGSRPSLRLAGVHVVVEPAAGRQRRVRTVGLGSAPHPEPGGGLSPAARIRRRRAGSLQHGPARAHHRQRRQLSESSRLLHAGPARRETHHLRQVRHVRVRRFRQRDPHARGRAGGQELRCQPESLTRKSGASASSCPPSASAPSSEPQPAVAATKTAIASSTPASESAWVVPLALRWAADTSSE